MKINLFLFLFSIVTCVTSSSSVRQNNPNIVIAHLGSVPVVLAPFSLAAAERASSPAQRRPRLQQFR
jgi:hypothetical protein